jgi:hypothetical protein
METFKYSFHIKFIYRYSILLLGLILIAYFVVLLKGSFANPAMLIPAAINIAVLYMAVKYFYSTYKRVPFMIICGKESLQAKDFIPGQKPVEIFYKDIDSISGGVFGYNPKAIIYVHDGRQNLEIGIQPNIDGAERLLRLILTRIDTRLKDELVEKLKRNNKDII